LTTPFIFFSESLVLSSLFFLLSLFPKNARGVTLVVFVSFRPLLLDGVVFSRRPREMTLLFDANKDDEEEAVAEKEEHERSMTCRCV
jgi:hypothetical protein